MSRKRPLPGSECSRFGSVCCLAMRATIDIMGSRALFKLDMDSVIGIVLWALFETLYGIHALLANNNINCSTCST